MTPEEKAKARKEKAAATRKANQAKKAAQSTATVKAKAPLKPVAVKISLDNLNLLTPQRQMLLSSINDLQGKVFVLGGKMTADPSISTNMEGENEDIQRIKLKFIEEVNRKHLAMNVRGLLNLEVMADGTGKFKKGETQTIRVYEHMQEESAGSNKSVEFPRKFEIVHAEERTNEQGDVLYPAYYYVDFNNREKELREAFTISNPGEEFDRGVMYQDQDFLNELNGTAKAPRYETAEAQKSVVIRIL